MGRQPTVEEIAEALGMDVEEYRFMLEEFYPLSLFTQREFIRHGDGLAFRDPNLVDDFLIDVLANEIGALPEEERLVMACRHQGNLTMQQVAAAMSLPEAAARQLHSQAILRLRNGITRACAALGTRMQ